MSKKAPVLIRSIHLVLLILIFHVVVVHGAILERQTLVDLNGEWHFKPDPEGVGEDEGWYKPGKIRERTIPVPTSWQVVFEDLRKYVGSAWYERQFTIPKVVKGRRIAVHFQGVDWYCKVWVNGEFAGEHEHAFEPFTVDITDHIAFGDENTLSLRVWDFEDRDMLFYDSEFAFLRQSGIWRSAWIEATGQVYTSDIFCMPDIDACAAEVRCEVTAPPLEEFTNLQLQISVKDPFDGRTFSTEHPLAFLANEESATQTITTTIFIDEPRLWDLENPNLYKAVATIFSIEDNDSSSAMLIGEGAIDQATTEFGMREFETRGTQLLLNKKPIYLTGALDFVDYPDRNIYLNPYRPWTDEDIKAELRRWKNMGFNYIRKYGIEDSRYMYWADRMGVLIMGEPSVVISYNPEMMQRWETSLRSLVRRDRNHPSVVMWTLFNEGGGFGGEVENLYKYYALAKQLDPTRLVIENSGGIIHVGSNNPPGNHPITDIEDVHYYFGMGPEWYPHNRQYLASIEARDKPVILTEMLALTYLPDMNKIRRRFGGEVPWWFNLPMLPGDAPDENRYLSSAEYEKTFHEWRMERYFGSFSEFARAHEERNFQVLKFEIEQIRKNPNLKGYTYTQMNQQPGQGPVGILGDYGFGDERIFQRDLSMINSQDLVFVDWKRLNYWTTEVFRAPVFFSHFGDRPIRDAVLRWSLEGTRLNGELKGINSKKTGVSQIGEIEFEIPTVENSVRRRLNIELEDERGLVSRNWMLVNIFPLKYKNPKSQPATGLYFPHRASVGDPMIVAHSRLAAAGIGGGGGLNPNTKVILTDVLDDKTLDYVMKGGTLLFVPKDTIRAASSTGLFIGENMYYTGHGGWPIVIDSAFNLFERIPYENPIEWPFYQVYSRQAIAGLSPDNIPDILAAAYGAWFLDTEIYLEDKSQKGQLAGMIAQYRCKKGRVVITTLNLIENVPQDPVATIILQDLVEYCHGDFQPEMELPVSADNK